MKRKLVREGQKAGARARFLERRLREEDMSEIDLRELKKVQEQFDSLIEQMLNYKILLAGLAVGADDVYVEHNVYNTAE